MSDTSATLPDWAEFERDYVANGVPHLFVVRANPTVALFVDQGGARFGAKFETLVTKSRDLKSMLAEIHVDDVLVDGRSAVEIWTDSEILFPNFYQLVSEIVRAVVDDGEAPDTALLSAVARWEALLSRPSLMSEESQAGLFGELWLLERLIGSMGPLAVDAWVGPVPQPHDFRLGDVELEVKTTSGSARVHTINGVGQLEPSLGCTLYLVSLKLANAGTGGRSLPEAVAAIEAMLAASPITLARFQSGLAKNGYDPLHANRYSRRRRLRDNAALIEVADGVPRLTSEALASIDAQFAPERLGRVVYAVNVDGMGVPDGSPAFLAVIPSSKCELPEPSDV